MQAGPAKAGSMGPDPIEWVDLAAYNSLTGALTEPWESETLIAMSQKYVRGLEEGKNPLSIPPVDRQ